MNYSANEVIVGLAHLADMLMEDSLTSKQILRFQEFLEKGMSIKEAQDEIVSENIF